MLSFNRGLIVRFANREMRMYYCLCKKIVTTNARVNLTETSSGEHSRILQNVFQVCVFRCATGMGTNSVIHFPALPM